jgi:ABC-2 type transport system ATP-binding protein
MAKDKAIVISTHLLEEVEMVCTHAIVIANGRIVADGTPADLEARSLYHNAVCVRLPRAHLDACRTQLEAIDGVARVETVDEMKEIAEVIAVPTEGSVIIGEVSSRIRASDIPIEEIRVERGRLDEVFRKITTGG